ncbi:hypothetical protein [Jannaschia sp. LMIT008]|uniref:hypothetical protein n=1 Tax=Jannaschia maritima TaxID=3032585 RepID=UPI002811BC66|nr:hypothetical protein [Jannaschia sp. LMIT008]
MGPTRRTVLTWLGASALAAVAPAPAAAQDDAGSFADDVVAALRDEGYADIRVRRTFLGRIRITGRRDGWRREVVLSESRGTILRDVERPLRGGGRPRKRALWRRHLHRGRP